MSMVGNSTTAAEPVLAAHNLVVGYGAQPVVRDISAVVQPGKITALIGPNGCGKSTLLRALGRQLTPTSGQVTLGQQPVAQLRARDFARRVSFLPQQPTVPESISVRELISFGRYPYTGAWGTLREEDLNAVVTAAQRVDIAHLLDAPASELSGGQQQRVWIAMVLAQEADIALLDEPTTYLDPAHQLATLDLIARLNEEGTTIVMVLHDMTQAARYADNVIAMKDGSIRAQGPSEEVLTAQLIREVFGVESLMVRDPRTGRLLPVPQELRRST